jgi:MoaA/NifB/PqqE/SkfB family radical SAM enzyme
MCDIWKDNKNLKQLTEQDIAGLIAPLKKLGTQQVLMSGGEALLNPNFFRFCTMLGEHGIRITLLSTGLTLGQHAENIVKHVHDVIVSLDGHEELHNRIRNIPSAYAKLKSGIDTIRRIDPRFSITGRTVVHRLNFRDWDNIIGAAYDLGLDSISFLPADVSSHAFNREVLWSEQRQEEVLPDQDELPELEAVATHIISKHKNAIGEGFIAESADKLMKIYGYYAAIYGLQAFPYKKCNAPWVSTVIEADGTVRPCFFHASMGNIKTTPLEQILNSEEAMRFRKELDMDKNETCVKCVCYLNLSARAKL